MSVTFEAKEIRPGYWRYLVHLDGEVTYGLCTCLDGHKTAELAKNCVKAQVMAKSFEEGV